MTNKQQWLLERLLIPAGILPPAVGYEDLRFNEQNRRQIGNAGFEYYYLLKQDPRKVSQSHIGGKTLVLHAPWPDFAHKAAQNPLIKAVVELTVFRGKKLTGDFNSMVKECFTMAKTIEAKSITLHIFSFDHHHLKEGLQYLGRLEEEYKIRVTIEHDGTYVYDMAKQGKYYLPVGGNFDWMINPAKMIKVLDKIYPAHKFNICFDPAPFISQNKPFIPTLKIIYPRLGHMHLASTEHGEDLPTEINNPEFVKAVEFLYQKKYPGFITVESNGAIGNRELRIAQIYAASSLIGLSLLKKRAVANAQKHIASSCQYLLKNLK